MLRRPPRSTRTDPLFPYTTLFRSRLRHDLGRVAGNAGDLMAAAQQFVGDARTDAARNADEYDVHGVLRKQWQYPMLAPPPAPTKPVARDGQLRIMHQWRVAPDTPACAYRPSAKQIGRAHVCTQVTNAQLV